MAGRTVRSRADSSIAWAVASLVVLAISMQLYVHAPRIVQAGGKAEHSLYLLVSGLAGVSVGIIILVLAAVLAVRAANSAPRGLALAYLRALRLPILLTSANMTIGLLLDSQWWSDFVFNSIRVFAALWAGWILGRRGFSIWKSAAAGLLLFVLDHVVMKGGWFLLSGHWLAFGGVLISFGMLALVPLVLGALGGVAARKVPPSNTTVETDAREPARGSP
jgi:hypothetical protein